MGRAQRLFVAVAVGLVAVGGVSMPAAAVVAPGPVAPYDALTFYAGAGEPAPATTVSIDKAGYVFDPSNSALAAQTFQDSVAITATKNGTGQVVSVKAIPPTSGPFVAGMTYSTAAVANESHARTIFTFPGAQCGGTGSLTVHEVTRDAAGAFTTFAATWELTCPDQDLSVFRGEIRWHSTRGYAGVVTSGAPLRGAPVIVAPTFVSSHPMTITYASSGTAPVHVTTPTLMGPDAGSFVITGSTCAGQFLAFGQACTVSIALRPQRLAYVGADLVLGSDLLGGGIAIRLNVGGTRNVQGMYTAVTPVRVLDTRIGKGAPKAPLGAGRTLHLKMTGVGGVPLGAVGAVVLNLTATAPTADTFLTTYPSLTTRPVTSSLNIRKGATVANMVTVPLSANGSLDIYNSAGATSVVADVLGYYASDPNFAPGQPLRPGTFHAVPARRLLDSRAHLGRPVLGFGPTRVTADFGAAINAAVTSLAVNITVTAPQEPGYLIVWDGGSVAPNTSTLNFTRGQTASNMALVQTGQSATGVPTFAIFGISGAFHLVVDVFGYYENSDQPGGLHFQATKPVRVVDTRTRLGALRLGTRGTATVTTPATLAGAGTRALVTNTTLVRPVGPTYLTLWPAVAGARPVVSNVNAPTGQVVAAATVTALGSGGRFNVFNGGGATDAVVDVVGTFEAYPVP